MENKIAQTDKPIQGRVKTSTYFALLAEFGTDAIPLHQVCEKFFGVGIKIAMRRASSQRLPIPVYKCAESNKANWFVSAQALAKLIEQQQEQAEKEWMAVNG